MKSKFLLFTIPWDKEQSKPFQFFIFQLCPIQICFFLFFFSKIPIREKDKENDVLKSWNCTTETRN